MLSNIALRSVLKSSAGVLRESGALCSAASLRPWTCSALAPRVSCVAASFAIPPPVRHYARPRRTAPQSQLSDLPPAMLKPAYAAVPLAQTTDDVIKRILSLELATHSEKLRLKEEQLAAKVRRHEDDNNSMEVRVAVLTARIRNYQEHMYKHKKDKANKRRLLMAIDKRTGLLKELRMVRYDSFEKVCNELGITYTIAPMYNRKLSKRAAAKKAFCAKVFNEVQKLKAEQKRLLREGLAPTDPKMAKRIATKAK